MEIRESVEVITPTAAKALLDHTRETQSFLDTTGETAAGRQRGVRRSAVNSYAQAMVDQQWALTYVPILIDTYGRVVDGQHRLLAVVQSGLAQRFKVVRGVDPTIANYLDIGARRDGGDFLQTQCGITKHGKRLAAAVNWVYRYDTGAMARNNGVPLYRMAEQLARCQGIERSVALSAGAYHVCRRGAVLAGAHFVFSRIDAAEADVFLMRIRDGVGLASQDPELLLRERLLTSNRGTSYNLRDLSALVVRAWNLRREGRTVQRLVWSPAKDAFPVAI